jgi:energy-coupling factor transporter ATP-binding protein EcfA2
VVLTVNPFSTTFWLAGKLPYRFREDESAEGLLGMIRHHRVCQIVGPKGSGKSTLVECLTNSGKATEKPIHFLDGFEQLPFWRRCWYRFFGTGYVFIVHKPLWCVPVVYRTVAEFDVFRQIVAELYPNGFDTETLQNVFIESHGNFRTAFFALYDRLTTGDMNIVK